MVFGWVGERGTRCCRDAVAVAAVVSLGLRVNITTS